MTTDTDTLREALLYYANDEHYDGGDVPGHIYVLDDHGRTARQALATLSKPEPAAVGEAIRRLEALPCSDLSDAAIDAIHFTISVLADSLVPSGGACQVCGIENRNHHIHLGPFTEGYHAFVEPSPSSEAISPPDARAVVEALEERKRIAEYLRSVATKRSDHMKADTIERGEYGTALQSTGASI